MVNDKSNEKKLTGVNVRISDDMIHEIEKLIKNTDKLLESNGNKIRSNVTFSDVMRMAISRGLVVLRKEISEQQDKKRERIDG